MRKLKGNFFIANKRKHVKDELKKLSLFSNFWEKITVSW